VARARRDDSLSLTPMETFLNLIVTGPNRMEELLARLRALIRRSSGQSTPELRCGPLVLDPRSGKVTLEGAEVKLTGHEFRGLSYLMHHGQRVVSQSELTEHIYSQDFDRDSNTVEVFIARLRRKLGPALIETVRSLGYRMKAHPWPAQIKDPNIQNRYRRRSLQHAASSRRGH
jgi:two-component system OmpR family response regulator